MGYVMRANSSVLVLRLVWQTLLVTLPSPDFTHCVEARTNFADRIIWIGDNLDIPRGLNSASVGLIYRPKFSERRSRPKSVPNISHKLPSLFQFMVIRQVRPLEHLTNPPGTVAGYRFAKSFHLTHWHEP